MGTGDGLRALFWLGTFVACTGLVTDAGLDGVAGEGDTDSHSYDPGKVTAKAYQRGFVQGMRMLQPPDLRGYVPGVPTAKLFKAAAKQAMNYGTVPVVAIAAASHPGVVSGPSVMKGPHVADVGGPRSANLLQQVDTLEKDELPGRPYGSPKVELQAQPLPPTPEAAAFAPAATSPNVSRHEQVDCDSSCDKCQAKQKIWCAVAGDVQELVAALEVEQRAIRASLATREDAVAFSHKAKKLARELRNCIVDQMPDVYDDSLCPYEGQSKPVMRWLNIAQEWSSSARGRVERIDTELAKLETRMKDAETRLTRADAFFAQLKVCKCDCGCGCPDCGARAP